MPLKDWGLPAPGAGSPGSRQLTGGDPGADRPGLSDHLLAADRGRADSRGGAGDARPGWDDAEAVGITWYVPDKRDKRVPDN